MNLSIKQEQNKYHLVYRDGNGEKMNAMTYDLERMADLVDIILRRPKTSFGNYDILRFEGGFE